MAADKSQMVLKREKNQKSSKQPNQTKTKPTKDDTGHYSRQAGT